VDSSFKFVSHGIFTRSIVRIVLLAPNPSSVVVMDIEPFLKRGFKVIVVCFPCYDLGVGAREIDVTDHVARVRKE